MTDYSPKVERQLINTDRTLEALSGLDSDADPAVLMATADELSRIADAIRTMKELGLVRKAVAMFELSNGTFMTIRQQDELGGTN